MPKIIVNWNAGYNYGGVVLQKGENIVEQSVVDLFMANEQIVREVAHGKLEIVADKPATEERTEVIGDITPADKPKPKKGK